MNLTRNLTRCWQMSNLLVLLTFFQSALAGKPEDTIRDYIKATYSDNLILTDEQIEQLAWVLDNPIYTPEMEVVYTNGKIHREIPRTLARLYSLKLLRSGYDDDYQEFIKPQIEYAQSELTKKTFMEFSGLIRSFDQSTYELLQASAIISAVTLSPEAKRRAAPLIQEMPADSQQFLTITAEHVDQIYPLAKQLLSRHPEISHLFRIAFLPDSHLRQMMYCEGSQAMYNRIIKLFQDKNLTTNERNVWCAHWLINIAGFRGHIAPVGSLYLTQPTADTIQLVRDSISQTLKDSTINPLEYYLQQRSNWLNLNDYSTKQEEQVAMATLGAMLRLSTPEQGKELYQGYSALPDSQKLRWISHINDQLKILDTPAPTYMPALLANGVELVGIKQSIIALVPILLEAFDLEAQQRQSGTIGDKTRLSFRELAEESSIRAILSTKKPISLTINRDTGQVKQ